MLPAQKDATGLAESALQVYLLGTVDYDAALRFQRRLHFEISGDRTQAALVLCEHPPLISVGRQGSRAHLHFEPEEFSSRRWPIRWVHRGGGCWLHVPGQLAVYTVLPLDRLGLSVTDYLRGLGSALQLLLADFDIRGEWQTGGVHVRSRLVAAVGAAVHDWVTSFGISLNIHPALDLFRHVRCAPSGAGPMTSIERERRGRVQPALVRQRLIEHFQAVFGFGRVTLFTDHAALKGYQERCRPAAPNVYA